jgi:hypothetical protein
VPVSIAHEVSWSRRGEDLFLPVARCKGLQLATQNYHHPEVALPRLEDDLTSPHDPSPAKRLQQRELPIVQLRKCDTLRIAVKLLVFLGISHGAR